MFSIAPSVHLAPSQALKFRELADRDTDPTASEIKTILDDCAYASLASDFTMQAIDLIWQSLVRTEAGVVPGSWFDLGQIAHESCIEPDQEDGNTKSN